LPRSCSPSRNARRRLLEQITNAILPSIAASHYAMPLTL
jgi:hypothetical protein